VIPQDQIDRIKREANDDIVAVVEQYVKLKRAGHSYKGLCPFHDENTPSFSVSPRRRMYKCFGCDESGDAIDFIQQMEGMNFIESIRHLAGILGIIINEEKRDTPNNYTPPSTIIPGIKEAKRHIRKADKAIISNAKKVVNYFQQKGKKNAVLIEKIRPKHGKVLAKYLSDHGHVIIIATGFTLSGLFKGIHAFSKQNLNIELAKNQHDTPQHWITFLSQHFDHTEKLYKAQVKILAAIPSTLKREIETRHFIHTWDQ